MVIKRKTIHNLVMREIFVSRTGELSHAGDQNIGSLPRKS